MEPTVSDSRKKTIAQFITQAESVRLTNGSIRLSWKTSAGLVALMARLLTSIVLAIIRIVRRNRSRW